MDDQTHVAADGEFHLEWSEETRTFHGSSLELTGCFQLSATWQISDYSGLQKHITFINSCNMMFLIVCDLSDNEL